MRRLSRGSVQVWKSARHRAKETNIMLHVFNCINPSRLIRICAALLLSVLFASYASETNGQSTWRLKLADVEVVQQRERSGDRPYFAVIQFRSRFNSRNSTRVNVLSYEPHDWVSKPEHRSGLSSSGNHLFERQRASLPFWMGDIEWRDMRPLPSPFVGAEVDLRRVTPDVLRMEVVGAVIIGLDNNNTPPHVIRGLLDSIGQVLDQALREKIERNTAVVATAASFQRDFEDRLEEIATGLITVPRVIDLLGQMTVGSTFNPDQIIGVHIFMMPVLDGFPGTESSRNLNLPTLVTAGPVEMRTKTLAVQPWSETLSFKGSGGEYRVRARFEGEACRTTVRDLNVSFLSGDDGLRDDSRIELELNVAGRGPMIVPLGRGDGDRVNRMFTRTARLPAPVNRSDIRQIGIRFATSSGLGLSPDNWTLNALQIGAGGGTIVSSTGRPLMRFTGQQGRLMLESGCVSDSTGGATPVADPLVQRLDVTIRTGDDDLRGGNDNAFIFAIMSGGRRVEAPFNRGARLADRTSRTASISLPAGTRLSQIERIGVRATVSGGVGGDNWNIDSVNVIAVAGATRQTLLTRSGRPLVRITGEKREEIWRIDR